MFAESVFCEKLPSFVGLKWRSRVKILFKTLLQSVVYIPVFLFSRFVKVFFSVGLVFLAFVFVVLSLGFSFSARLYFQKKLQLLVQEITFWIFLPFDFALALIRLICRFGFQKTVL